MISVIYVQGQTLKYSDLTSSTKRPKGIFESYESKDGSIYKVGDTIVIGTPSVLKSFAFIYEGSTLLGYTSANIALSGNNSEIKRILATGTRRSGFSVQLVCKDALGVGGNIRVDLENAIKSGEVKSFGMTSDEALAELKKAKDKLDLGLISEEEYEKIKAELIKYIK